MSQATFSSRSDRAADESDRIKSTSSISTSLSVEKARLSPFTWSERNSKDCCASTSRVSLISASLFRFLIAPFSSIISGRDIDQWGDVGARRSSRESRE
eukprot:scaffold13524_cov109-Isochrysis_galbana.AAC.6